MPKYLKTNSKYSPPPKDIVHFLAKFTNWYFDPQYFGLENLSKDKPALYVSNHTLLGITDGPLYTAKLYEDLDIFLRVLVDNLHLGLPLWRSIMTDLGAVTGSREHVLDLMHNKQHILVFPGGANEVCKVKGEEYKLVWKERYGFVKLAIENSYPIIPISSLGGDELYDILVDKEEVKDSKLGEWLKEKGILDKYFKGGENIPPLVKGIGPTLFPKPKKLYYKFGKAIETKHLKKDSKEENLKEMRDQVEAAIYDGISELKAIRSKEEVKEENPIRKFLSGL
ncbi:MAG: acyltransferase family protein [Chitinophagales bacterium]|nr:acyltransferase family protein [Chitinophagales bacterium]